MSIDFLTEDIISLTDGARMLPARRKGRRPHVSCIYRWTTSGCKGVVLECVQVGGTRCTSRQAIARFIERLSAGQRDAPPNRTASQRNGAAQDAERQLEKLGI